MIHGTPIFCENVIVSLTHGQMYHDGTMITSDYCEHLLARSWFHMDRDYLCTVDICNLTPFQTIQFSETPLRSMHIQNAGGSSEISEALSMYYMEHQFGAVQFVPEKEVDYWIDYKMCDYLMTLNQANIGVSVTRAVTYPFDQPFTDQLATTLLDKKLNGLIIARNAVNLRHQFFKSILHIWCYTALAATNLKKAYYRLINNDQDQTYSNIYVICTICQQKYIYTNHVI